MIDLTPRDRDNALLAALLKTRETHETIALANAAMVEDENRRKEIGEAVHKLERKWGMHYMHIELFARSTRNAKAYVLRYRPMTIIEAMQDLVSLRHLIIEICLSDANADTEIENALAVP